MEHDFGTLEFKMVQHKGPELVMRLAFETDIADVVRHFKDFMQGIGYDQSTVEDAFLAIADEVTEHGRQKLDAGHQERRELCGSGKEGGHDDAPVREACDAGRVEVQRADEKEGERCAQHDEREQEKIREAYAAFNEAKVERLERELYDMRRAYDKALRLPGVPYPVGDFPPYTPRVGDITWTGGTTQGRSAL